MTLDYDAFRESLDALDENVIPRGGTNIAAAIREAEAVFKTRTTAEKILVLITDGEDLDGEGHHRGAGGGEEWREDFHGRRRQLDRRIRAGARAQMAASNLPAMRTANL